MDLVATFANLPALKSLWPNLNSGRHLVTGLTGSAKTMMIAAAVASVQHPLLVVENDRNHADELAADLANVLPVSSVFAYPVEDVLTVEAAVTSLDARNDRINALNFLMQDEPGVVITSMAGLRRLLPDVTTWQNAQLRVDATTELDPAKVAEQLVAMGYRRDNLVNAPGMFAIRGGIIDVYPLDADQPVRIELFDTEVDSIRSFDADTQRSQDMLDAVTITPPTAFWSVRKARRSTSGFRCPVPAR